MATSQDAVRRLTIQTSAPGADQAAASLHKVEDALSGVTVASQTTERATLNLDKSFGSIEKKYVATVRAQQEYDKTQRMVNAAVAQNPALQERANAVMAAAAERLRAANGGLNDNVKQMGLARHELINLGRQAQDVGTMLAMGASVGQVATSQAAQVIDIFASSQGSFSGFMKQATSAVTNFLTVGRVVFGGVAVAIGGAALALNSYLDSQQKVQMSLLGSGRSSGQSVSSINAVAQAGSSTTGLSVSEARAFAAELASTGKIGKDNLEPLVKIGHDISVVFGTDAAGAAQLLGKAFSDPIAGADQLNARLGFLDAAMQRNIQNLVAQNRTQEAQRVLQAGVVSGLEGVSDAVSTSTKFWTALGNVASNAWDKIGAAASRATGIGLKLGLDEQLQQAQARLQELEAIASRRSAAANQGLGTTGKIEAERAKIDELTAAMQRYSQASVDAQQRQQSFAQAAAVRNQLPEIDQLQKLRNEQELLVKTMIDVQTTGGPASEVLKRMGVSYEELAKALSVANSNMTQFKSGFQSSLDQAKIAGDALTAFSPGARGDIARRQSMESTLGSKMTDGERDTLAQQAYQNAVKSVTVSLTEQARARALSAQQSADSAAAEINMIGQTIGKQTELRANLQARQALEQQASQNRTGFDNAEYERLKKINEELGKRTQEYVRAQINDQIKFDKATIGLTPEDVQIAQQLRTIYPDVATALGSTEAAGMRLNNQMREAKDISSGFANDLVGGLLRGEDAMKAMGTAATNLVQKLASSNVSRFMQGGSLFGNQSLNSAQGAVGMVGAGVSGYQSGNALTGALGGAMAGATFGPAGAVAGGIIGLVGGIFGANEQSKKKLEAAQKVWKDSAPAFAAFITAMTGGAQGDISASLAQQFQNAKDLAIKADEARDYASVTKIYESFAGYARKQAETFVSTFGATMQGLADGLGPNSPFLTAVNNTKSQVEGMLKFVDDARISRGIYNGGISAGNSEITPGARADQIAEINAAASAASSAAQAYLLSLLQSAPALSTVQTALLNVNGTAAALQESLVRLGMSSEGAAAAIANGASRALSSIKAQFETSLTERMNVASGKSYLNEASALVKQHMQDIADASLLGVDPAKVSALFSAEAQKIVEDAGLVGDSFNQFIDLFPTFSGAVKAATDQLTASIKSINDYLDSLKIGNQSVLSPQEKLNEAQSQFNAQLTLAQKGNTDAMGTITQYASSLLDQAKAFYASSAGYGDVYGAVTAALKGLTGAPGMALGGIVPGYAAGGVVGNGVFGVDSVIARYAGGGSIGLAGGEFVMPAAQTQMHLPMLEAMRSGASANDNGQHFQSLGQQLVRAMAGCSMGEIAAIREENAALRADIRKLTAAVEANRPKAPRPADRGRAA